MNKSLAILLLLASPASAEVGRIDSTMEKMPVTPHRYVVIVLPENHEQSAKSQSLLKGFKANPPENTIVYWYWPQSPKWADFKYRFEKRLNGSRMPIVLGMNGDKIEYKRSDADYESEMGVTGGGRLRQWLFPNAPDCPDNNCPLIDDPYPDNPLKPIPDTPSIPDTPAIPDTPSGPTPEQLEVQRLIVLVEQLQARIVALEQRPAPRDGEDGDDGKPGTPGTPGTPGKDATLDYDKLIAELIPKLPPIRFDRLSGDGAILDSTAVHLGQHIGLPATRFNYLSKDKSIIDTESVPIGGTINLHIIPPDKLELNTPVK